MFPSNNEMLIRPQLKALKVKWVSFVEHYFVDVAKDFATYFVDFGERLFYKQKVLCVRFYFII